MIRGIKFALIISVILCGSASAGEPISVTIDFLRTQAALIKGDIPSQESVVEALPHKCGTPIFLAAHAMKQKSDNLILETLQTRPDPDSMPLSLASEHFIVHYIATGRNAPYRVAEDVNPADGVPDYVNRVSEIFEHVWQKEIDSLGYTAPPTDQARGGDDRYDIYLVNLGFGYFGFTDPEDGVDLCVAPSFIELENDFQESQTYHDNPIAGVQVTAAHEFFHSIQFGYDACEFEVTVPDSLPKPWWMEASAVWMEDVVYDNVNDYLGYLHFFYKYIWMSLTTFSYGGDVRAFHPYGSCVWPIFMTEKFEDENIIRDIWDECATVKGYNTLPSTDNVLRQRSSSIGDAFLEFEIWNFHTGEFADIQNFYSEGDAFPAPETTLFINDLQSQSQVSVPNTIQFPEQYATNYIIIESSSQLAGGVEVDFGGQVFSGQNWRAALLGYENHDSRWHDMGLDPSTGQGADSWPGWNFYQDVVLIPTVTGLNANPNHFSYSAILRYDPSLVGGDSLAFGVSDAYPSPFLLSSATPMTVPYSLDRRYATDEVILSIFDVSGQLVRKIEAKYSGPGSHSNGLEWDGKNNSGELVASGVYIFVLSAGNKSDKGKIAVINDSQ